MTDLFVITAWDAPGSGAARDAQRAAHFAHVESIIESFAVAGPLYDADGRITGSMVVIKAASAAEAEAVLKSDPYYQAGVWERWTIHRYRAAAGDWVGGKTW